MGENTERERKSASITPSSPMHLMKALCLLVEVVVADAMRCLWMGLCRWILTKSKLLVRSGIWSMGGPGRPFKQSSHPPAATGIQSSHWLIYLLGSGAVVLGLKNVVFLYLGNHKCIRLNQRCWSGSELDQYSALFVDPDLYSDYVSGSTQFKISEINQYFIFFIL